MKLEEAREQLQFAREHLESVRNIKSHSEFRKWWQAFRTCINTACNSADNILDTLVMKREVVFASQSICYAVGVSRKLDILYKLGMHLSIKLIRSLRLSQG
ncbi:MULTISPECIES: hypothetical protein [unclassified Halomonas]|uniref:hypothetical protein n=1 Tax=unclassified Halomonas TaxID=2609666 RepID=UPI0011B5AE59|nr:MULTISPECIES: hypothetical protein [unclassified Halomonas]